MLYPHNREPRLDESLFKAPTSEYRAAPFWAWNCKLNQDELLRQIDVLREMGMGGFHMHCRSGMSTPYLSDEFGQLIMACVQKAKDTGMLAWLYDEDRWPSGAAGGLVTCNPAMRIRYLLFTAKPYAHLPQIISDNSRADGGRLENGTLLAKYDVLLNEQGELAAYKRLEEGETPQGTVWYAYLEVAGNSAWYNNQAYLDTLSPKAVQAFVQTTHEWYAKLLGKDLGVTAPAIFTDEPQFVRKRTLGRAASQDDVTIPFTSDLCESYQAQYHDDLLAHLPELFWELPGGEASLTRYRYHDHVAERFAEAFADTVGNWCSAHGLMLTGHMMEEPSLESQTCALGDCMRSYRSFHLPGIDMLCDRREYTTAKQAQSAACQYGAPGVLSELYGVTGWDFDFRGHKLQGDWQAALGVTVRVPHLSWVSMLGEAKRDYPASINYQSPWWREYYIVEDHFARLNTALTRGHIRVRVAVVHPVESYWLAFGPAEQTHDARAEMDHRFKSLSEWLLSGLIDYHYLCESLLPGQCTQGGMPLKVGHMDYDVVIVPDMRTIRSSTLERLEAFRAQGGHLIFMGHVPELVDAEKSPRARLLAEVSERIPFGKTDVLNALRSYREVDVRMDNGVRMENLLYQMREDGNTRWLFICNGKPADNPDMPKEQRIYIRIKGLWSVTEYNTQTGETRPVWVTHNRSGETEITRIFYAHDSILLHLEKTCAASTTSSTATLPVYHEITRFRGQYAVTLSEPNVLLLDQAEWALDGGEWHPKNEILRIDRSVRAEIGLAPRDAQSAQPWVVPDSGFGHALTFRVQVNAESDANGIQLAMEYAQNAHVMWDGIEVPIHVKGWYIDREIETIDMPDIRAGMHTLEITVPLSNRIGAEWMYLLGNFGVRVSGEEAVLTAPVKTMTFGDITRQGLPFYGGNVTYHIPYQADGNFTLEICQYRAPLLAVALDGKPVGHIIYSPYRLDINAEPGPHTLDVTAFGNRQNTCGPLHLCNPAQKWYGPSAWRSNDAAFSNEYRLRDTGILVSPRILKSDSTR